MFFGIEYSSSLLTSIIGCLFFVRYFQFMWYTLNAEMLFSISNASCLPVRKVCQYYHIIFPTILIILEIIFTVTYHLSLWILSNINVYIYSSFAPNKRQDKCCGHENINININITHMKIYREILYELWFI